MYVNRTSGGFTLMGLTNGEKVYSQDSVETIYSQMPHNMVLTTQENCDMIMTSEGELT